MAVRGRKDAWYLSHAGMMTQNDPSCGLQPESIYYHPTESNRGSIGKGSNQSRASVDGRGRLNLGSISSFSSRVGTGSIVSRGKCSKRLTTLESSSSLSSNGTNVLLGRKDSQRSLSTDLNGAMECRPASSDESGSESDSEVAGRVGSILPSFKETIGKNSSVYPSTSGSVVASKGKYIHRDVGPSIRQGRFHRAKVPTWEDYQEAASGEARSARIASNRAYSYDLEKVRGFGTSRDPKTSLWSGFASADNQHDYCYTTSNSGKKDRPYIDRVCSVGIELGRRQPQRTVTSTNSSESLEQLLGSGRGTESKRKLANHSVLGQRRRPSSLNLGFRESNSSAFDVTHKEGQGRRNLSGLSCTSAADVLPSVSNSSAAKASQQMRHKRIVRTADSNDGGAGLRGPRLSMSRVTGGSSGSAWHTVGNKRSGGQSTQLNFTGADLLPARPINRGQHSGFQPNSSCSRTQNSLDSERMAMSAFAAFGNMHSATPNGRGRGGDIFGSRHRNSFIAPLFSTEQHLDSAVAFREEFPNRFAGSSSRISSRTSTAGNLINTVRAESDHSSRSTADSLLSSSAMISLPETHFTQSFLSGSPPTRPPPLAHFGSISTHSINSQIAQSLPSFSTSSPNISHDSGSHLLLSLEEQGRRDASAAEAAGYGTFHGSALHSAGESQARLTVDSLAEILSALEHIERDQELSYEQILMLEATILLGGIGLHDQHRDMRLDVDNMSYEELLALEERIGKVNTGLNEESIACCVKKIQYAPSERTGDHILLDVEIQCSICQEEFVDNAELGLLDCGHSYHIACIKQWLLQKNQCPICKATACA